MNKFPIDITLISTEQVKNKIDGNFDFVLNCIEEAFNKRANNNVLLPDKISQIFDVNTQERINCMPSTLMDEKICGMKWVSVFPPNTQKGIQNISGVILLSELTNGFPIALVDGTYCTAIRTAGVGGIAAKYLSKENCETIGFIGAGEQARMHFEIIKHVRPNIKKCYVSSKTDKTVLSFIETLSTKYSDVEFINCENNFKKATIDADIIVTATSSQIQILQADWIKDGALYIHVGGLEDSFDVPRKASKIVCDEWDAVKHRTQTISLMYKSGELKDEGIYANIGDIVSGSKKGRENDHEFIYFNSVGLSYIDVLLGYRIYQLFNKKDNLQIFKLQ